MDHESEDKSKSWKERKSTTVEGLKKQEDMDALMILLSNKLPNIRAIHRDYKVLGDEQSV